MKKTLYLLTGIIFICLAGFTSFYFYSDVVYLFTNPAAHTSLVRTLGILASWILGVIYLSYGIKTEQINRVSTTSLVLLFLTLLSSFLFSLFAGCPVGGICPSVNLIMDSLYRNIFEYGVAASTLLSIISLYFRNK